MSSTVNKYVLSSESQPSYFPWLSEGEYFDIVLNPNGEYIDNFQLSVTSNSGVWYPSELQGLTHQGEVTPVFNIKTLGPDGVVELEGYDFAVGYNRLHDIGYTRAFSPNGPITYADQGMGQFNSFFHSGDPSSWGVFPGNQGEGLPGLIFGSSFGPQGNFEIALISPDGAEGDDRWTYSVADNSFPNSIYGSYVSWDGETSSFFQYTVPRRVIETDGVDEHVIDVRQFEVSIDAQGDLAVEVSSREVSVSAEGDPLLALALGEDETASSTGFFFQGGNLVQGFSINVPGNPLLSQIDLVYDLDFLAISGVQAAAYLIVRSDNVSGADLPGFYLPGTFVQDVSDGFEILDLTSETPEFQTLSASDVRLFLKLDSNESLFFYPVDRVGDELLIHYEVGGAYGPPTSVFSEAPQPSDGMQILVYDLSFETFSSLEGSPLFVAQNSGLASNDFYFWNGAPTPLDIQWQLVDARGNIVESISEGTTEQVSLRLYALRDGVAESASGIDYPIDYAMPFADRLDFTVTVNGTFNGDQTRTLSGTFNVSIGEGTGFKTYTDASELFASADDRVAFSPAGARYQLFHQFDIDGDGIFETRLGDSDVPGDPYEFWLDFSKIDAAVHILAELGLAFAYGEVDPIEFQSADYDILYSVPTGTGLPAASTGFFEEGTSYGFNAYKLGDKARFDGLNDASEIVSIAKGSGHDVRLGGSSFGTDFDVISFRDYDVTAGQGFSIDLNPDPELGLPPSFESGELQFFVTGAEAVVGSRNNDTIVGFSDRFNLINGGAGADDITGGDASNILLAGFDDDADTVRGGDGDDILLGGANDEFEGGQGKDLFLFASDTDGFSGAISDFELSSSRLSLSPRAGSAADRFGVGLDLTNLSAAFSQVGMMTSQLEALINSARWSDDVDNSSANIALRRLLDVDIKAQANSENTLDVRLFVKSENYLRDLGGFLEGVGGGRLISLDGPEIGPLATISIRAGDYIDSLFTPGSNSATYEAIFLPESYDIVGSFASSLPGSGGSGFANALGYVLESEPYNALESSSYPPVAYSSALSGIGTGDVMLFHFALARTVEGVVSASPGVSTNFARKGLSSDPGASLEVVDLPTIFRVSNDPDDQAFLGGRAADKYEFIGREFVDDTGQKSLNQTMNNNLIIERGVLPGQVTVENRDSIVVDGLSAFDPGLNLERVRLGREGEKSLHVSWEETLDDLGDIVMNKGDLNVFKQFDGINDTFRVEDIEFVYEGNSTIYDLGVVKTEVLPGPIKVPLETEIVTSDGRNAMLVGRDSVQDLFVVQAGSPLAQGSSFEVHLWGLGSNGFGFDGGDVLEVRGYGSLLAASRNDVIEEILTGTEGDTPAEVVIAKGVKLHYSGDDLVGASDDFYINLYLRDFMVNDAFFIRTDALDDGVIDLAAVLWTDDGFQDYSWLEFVPESLTDIELDRDGQVEVYVLDAGLEVDPPATPMVDYLEVFGLGLIQREDDVTETSDVYDPFLTPSELIEVDSLSPASNEWVVTFEGEDQLSPEDNVDLVFVFERPSENSDDLNVFAFS